MRMDLICLDLRSHGESTLQLKEYAHVFSFNLFLNSFLGISFFQLLSGSVIGEYIGLLFKT